MITDPRKYTCSFNTESLINPSSPSKFIIGDAVKIRAPSDQEILRGESEGEGEYGCSWCRGRDKWSWCKGMDKWIGKEGIVGAYTDAFYTPINFYHILPTGYRFPECLLSPSNPLLSSQRELIKILVSKIDTLGIQAWQWKEEIINIMIEYSIYIAPGKTLIREIPTNDVALGCINNDEIKEFLNWYTRNVIGIEKNLVPLQPLILRLINLIYEKDECMAAKCIELFLWYTYDIVPTL